MNRERLWHPRIERTETYRRRLTLLTPFKRIKSYCVFRYPLLLLTEISLHRHQATALSANDARLKQSHIQAQGLLPAGISNTCSIPAAYRGYLRQHRNHIMAAYRYTS